MIYIYPGKKEREKAGDVIGFFDLDSTTETAAGRSFLRKSEASGRLLTASFDIPKSFVLVAPVKRNAGRIRNRRAEKSLSDENADFSYTGERAKKENKTQKSSSFSNKRKKSKGKKKLSCDNKTEENKTNSRREKNSGSSFITWRVYLSSYSARSFSKNLFN